MTYAVTGYFTSSEQVEMVVRELLATGFAADALSYWHREGGEVALRVVPDARETEAIAIMARHGAESIEKAEGQAIGDLSNAPREGDNAPVVTEPIDSPQLNLRPRRTLEEQSPFERGNLAQTTGQYYDMTRSRSDDGTVPPTVHREAATTPPTAHQDRTRVGAPVSSTGAPEAAGVAPLTDAARQPETPLQEFAARGSEGTSPEPNRIKVMETREMIEEPVPPPAATVAARQAVMAPAAAEWGHKEQTDE